MSTRCHSRRNRIELRRNSVLLLGGIIAALLIPLTILINVRASGGDNDPAHFGVMSPEEQTVDDISPEQRAEVEKKIARHERTKKSKGKSKGISTTAPSDPPTLQPYAFFPQAGTLWQDLYVNNFVDLDSGGGILDWDCTQQTYNGHTGHDSDIRSFREQGIGVPVFAALDGTVVDLHDGEPDTNTSAQGQPANYVVLYHGNTHYTWYWHLKNGSVAVTMNQVVKAGTQIGLTGSSGSSTHPHLHFESRYSGTVFEPSAGPCRTGTSNWVQQVPIRRDMYVRDFGFSTTALSGNLAFDNSTRTGTYLLGTSSEWFRADLSNVPANSSYRIRYRRPDGVIALDYTGAFNNASAYRKAMFYWNFLVNLNTAGTWRLLLSINNQQLVDTPFQVVSSQSQIVNRAPNSITLGLDPATPSASDVIFCRVQTSPILEDPDYDTVRYRYRWSVNGTVVRDVTSAALSDALRKGLTNGGDSVTCNVTPSDGVLSGAAASSVVNISGSPTGNVLQNGVPVSGLSGAGGSQQFWTMSVPAGVSNLQFQTSGGTGDADLYVRFGSAPTTSTYDCGPATGDNNELCSFASPAAGTWHVMVYGYAPYSGASLVGSYQTGSPSTCNSISDVEPNDSMAAPQVISGNCNQISGTFVNDAASQQNDFFRLSLPAGQTVTALLNGLTVDYDLYIYDAAGNQVASSEVGGASADQASWTNTGTSAVNVHVLVWRYASTQTTYQLKVSYPVAPTCNAVSDVEPNDSMAAPQVISGSCNQISGTFVNDAASQQNDFFRLSLPAGQTVTALLNGLTVDYDLYIYDAAGNQVASSEAGGTSADQASWTNGGASAVNVYVLVWRYSSTQTTYQLKVSY
jgi:hypothetical protein